mgnify:FL=1
MAYKSTGTAGKSASGASMSKYDVEVEARLQALEAVVHDHSETSSTSIDDDLRSKIEEMYTWFKDYA